MPARAPTAPYSTVLAVRTGSSDITLHVRVQTRGQESNRCYSQKDTARIVEEFVCPIKDEERQKEYGFSVGWG